MQRVREFLRDILRQTDLVLLALCCTATAYGILMIYSATRYMNTLRLAEQNGVFTVDDQVVTARIYAKEVEHSEWNLEYMADEFLFGEAYTPENLCVALTRQ